MKLNYVSKLILLVLFCTCSSLHSQIFKRVSAGVSIKEIRADSSQHLMVGRVYFDRHIREIIYDIRFPNSSKFAVTDFGMLYDTTSVSMQTQFTAHLIDFSIFNLILNGQLAYFGLDNTSYELTSSHREDDMVISEWQLPEEMRAEYGKMLLSQKDKQLYAMVSFNAEGEIVGKQFFKEYKDIRGMMFPTKLIQFSYTDGLITNKKITTFNNISFNDTHEALYHFK